jgi:hypothetical protein
VGGGCFVRFWLVLISRFGRGLMDVTKKVGDVLLGELVSVVVCNAAV